MEPTVPQPKLTLPIAIVIAGVLIAGAVLISGKGKQSDVTATTATKVDKTIEIEAVRADDHIVGNPNANIVVVEFSDTECPFCKNFHTTMNQIVDEYGKDGKVAWVYRHFPLDQLHPKARKEAEATECAYELGGNEGFWKFTNRIYEITPANNKLDEAELPKIAEFAGINTTAFASCLASGKYADKVEGHYQEALKAGGRGTPYNVILLSKAVTKEMRAGIESVFAQFPPDTISFDKNNKKIALSGAMPYELMKFVIETLTK